MIKSKLKIFLIDASFEWKFPSKGYKRIDSNLLLTAAQPQRSASDQPLTMASSLIKTCSTISGSSTNDQPTPSLNIRLLMQGKVGHKLHP